MQLALPPNAYMPPAPKKMPHKPYKMPISSRPQATEEPVEEPPVVMTTGSCWLAPEEEPREELEEVHCQGEGSPPLPPIPPEGLPKSQAPVPPPPLPEGEGPPPPPPIPPEGLPESQAPAPPPPLPDPKELPKATA